MIYFVDANFWSPGVNLYIAPFSMKRIFGGKQQMGRNGKVYRKELNKKVKQLFYITTTVQGFVRPPNEFSP